MKFPSAFFVTGTDTNVGKTVVSAVLTRGLGACYWKPVQSGALEGTDSAWVRSITGLPQAHFPAEAYVLQQPLSPHEAARIDGVDISLDKIQLPATGGKPLVVEGAGGVLVPLNQRELMADLIAHLALPAVVVSRSSLGTINHTLMTLHCLRSKGIAVIGVVMNGEPNAANRLAIEFYGNTQVIAEIPLLQPLDKQALDKAFACFDQSPQQAEPGGTPALPDFGEISCHALQTL